MDYKETLEYINNITWLGSKLGLDRIKELLESIGNPQNKLKFVHIGGTNGKGSTAAMLSSVLEKAGYRVGLFTSPYIDFFNERMQINNIPISNNELAEIATYIRPFSDVMEDPATEFELNTAIAMEFFYRNKCDIVVLEVGMGGELDSTNIIDTPELAIITAIGLDHVKELGGTIQAIAKTKAGIIKKNGDVLVYEQDKEITDIIEENCKEKNAHYFSPDFSGLKLMSSDIYSQHFMYHDEEFCIGLIGTYQIYNAVMALRAVEILRTKGWHIGRDAVQEGLKAAKWPGRFEIILREPVFIVDGAHNPHGIKATAASIKKHLKNQKVIFLFGVMADKDVENMLKEITPLASEFFTVTPDNPRAMPAEKLAELIQKYSVKATPCTSIGHGVDSAINAAGLEGAVCAIGSLYMIGDIRSYLNNKKGEIQNGN